MRNLDGPRNRQTDGSQRELSPLLPSARQEPKTDNPPTQQQIQGRLPSASRILTDAQNDLLVEAIKATLDDRAWPNSRAINGLAHILEKSGHKLDVGSTGAQAFSNAIKSFITPSEWAIVSMLKKHGDGIFLGGAITGLVGAGFLFAGRQFQFPWLAEYGAYPFFFGNSLTGFITLLKGCENIPERMTLKRRLQIATPLLDAAIKIPALVEKTAEHLLSCAARAERLGGPELIPQKLLNDALSALGTHFEGRQGSCFLIDVESQRHLLKLASSLKPEHQQLAQTAAKILAYTPLDDKIEEDLTEEAADAAAYCAQARVADQKAGRPPNHPISVTAGQAELFKLLALPELFSPQAPITRTPALHDNLVAFSAVIHQTLPPPT